VQSRGASLTREGAPWSSILDTIRVSYFQRSRCSRKDEGEPDLPVHRLRW
jgi:hypothetical protein